MLCLLRDTSKKKQCGWPSITLCFWTVLGAKDSSGLFSDPTCKIVSTLRSCDEICENKQKTDRHIIGFENKMWIFGIIIYPLKNSELASPDNSKNQLPALGTGMVVNQYTKKTKHFYRSSWVMHQDVAKVRGVWKMIQKRLRDVCLGHLQGK